MKKIKYMLKDNPSKGVINYKKYPKFDRNSDCFYLEGLSYQDILELDHKKNEKKTRLERLSLLIDYLIPEELKDLPLCDMFYIMTQVSILSGLDVIDEKIKYEKSIANNTTPDKIKPYYLPNVICPNCGRVHSKVEFELKDLLFLSLDENLVAGSIKWKNKITFSNYEENIYYKFEYPSVASFHEILKIYIDNYTVEDEKYYLNLKIIALASALTKIEDNNISSNYQKIEDMKNLFRILTGQDAMKIEMIYSDLIQPVAFINFNCDCEGAPSVIDISYTITDVIRLIYVNRQRAFPEVYDIPREDENKFNGDAL